MTGTGYTLSFIISTKNRLPFLKILFAHLLPILNPDEEIVVVDSESTDGSAEFLHGLFAANKIHQFISEPDNNQAHGWNKALLMAKGTIIKKLIDDDVHDLSAIRRCRDFMLQNKEVDICISDMLAGDLANPGWIGSSSRLPYYRQWKNGTAKTFTFSDVTMLQRRSSLSLLGLYDTQFKMIDWEYSLRVTYLNAKIAYYTGYNSMSVPTPGNVSSSATKKIFRLEEHIGKIKYEYSGDESDISFYAKIKVWIGETYYNLKNKIAQTETLKVPAETELMEIYATYYQQLEEQNKKGGWEFIF
jgi:glycosyltransferase involved in cell wall biosynthesis